MELRRAPARPAALALLGVMAALVWPSPAGAQPKPPALTQAVNDFAGVIDASSAQALGDLSRRLLEASGDAVVVATVKTFKPWGDIRSFATAMFENQGRGVGAKGKDNGVLVVLAVDDRQVWVEVGYDLEGIITDGFAGETSRRVMTPHFRDGRYGQGLFDGTSQLVGRIARARNVSVTGVPAESVGSGEDRIPVAAILFVIVVFVVIMSIKDGTRGGPRRRWRGGVGPWGGPYYGGTWGGGSSWSRSSGGFGGFGGGRSGGGGGGASW